MKYILILLFPLLTATTLQAQTETCRHLHKSLHEVEMKPKETFKKEKKIYEKTQALANLKTPENIHKIPTAIHLIHENGATTLTDEQILNGLTLINEKFNDSNTQIEFCLAQQDIFGNDSIFSTTNGITRTVGNPNVLLGNPDIETVRPMFTSQFPRTAYLNIFIVNTICEDDNSQCYSGIAPLAFAHGEWWDVVVVRSFYWDTDSKINRVIHELGHYLHLYHTFENGCNNENCLLDGDLVCDTPPAIESSNTCERNSCDTDINEDDQNNPFTTDEFDATDNYMDLSDTDCQTNFTEGQKVRMRLAIEELRPSLLSSNGCLPPDCTDTTDCVFTLDLWALLEGAYDTTTQRMTKALYNNQLLPLQQPYHTAPHFYNGTEAVTSYSDFPLFPVDWVLVEVRQGTPSTTTTPNTTIIEQQAAILLPNGKIVNTQREALKLYNLIEGENYHIVIRHRNHLAIMSQVIQAKYFIYYNFTTSTNKAIGFTQQIKKGNKATMRAGDFNADGIIQITDLDLWKQNPAIVNTYAPIDATLDGIVQLTDNDAWLRNKAKIGFVEIRY